MKKIWMETSSQRKYMKNLTITQKNENIKNK